MAFRSSRYESSPPQCGTRALQPLVGTTRGAKKRLSGRLHWRFSPHGLELRAHVDRGNFIPDTLFKTGHHRLREEAALRAINVPITHARLLRHVVLERRDEVEVALGARRRHIEEALFLLDLRRAA